MLLNGQCILSRIITNNNSPNRKKNDQTYIIHLTVVESPDPQKSFCPVAVRKNKTVQFICEYLNWPE